MGRTGAFDRRKFLVYAGQAAALSALGPSELLWASAGSPGAAPTRLTWTDPTRISWRAHQGSGFEGERRLTKIEGEIPRDLRGSFIRNGPGEKKMFGTRLRHFFDGEAYLAAYDFSDGRVRLRARFLDTPARRAQQTRGQMLTPQFGTRAPHRGGPTERPPNVTIRRGPHAPHNELFAFSDSTLPVRVRQSDFSYLGESDFAGTFPKDSSFTAHPRIDPVSGDWIAFGLDFGLRTVLRVVRISAVTGASRTIGRYELPMGWIPLVHDLMVTENHVLILIPSVGFSVWNAMRTDMGLGTTLGDSLRFERDRASTLLIFSKHSEGEAPPVRKFSLAPQVTFHHGNAFERADGAIVFDSTTVAPASLDAMREFGGAGALAPISGSCFSRYELNLGDRASLKRSDLAAAVDFPHFDLRRTGLESRYTFGLKFDDNGDSLRSSACVRVDARSGEIRTLPSATRKDFAWGEPVFVPRTGVPHELSGWILVPAYDGARDESFLEIRDADTLDLAARVWAGVRLPLGFHGSWIEPSARS